MASELSCVQVLTEESKEDSASQQPCLLITDGEKHHIQNSMFNNKPHHNFYYDVGGEIPEFHGRTIGCFCSEWVLLIGSYDDGLPEVLVNLLTKETIELPLLDFVSDFCILTSPPSDPTCHVVFFKKAEEEKDEAEGDAEEDDGVEDGAEENDEQEDAAQENDAEENDREEEGEENEEDNENSLIIWKPGDKEFTIKKWDFEIFPNGEEDDGVENDAEENDEEEDNAEEDGEEDGEENEEENEEDYETFPSWNGVRAVVAGKLFFDICHDRNGERALVMVEFQESTYRVEVVQMDCTEIEFMPSYRNYFFEYSGELFALYKFKCGYHSWKVAGFKIFKADLLKKKWDRIKNLGRLAIFIDYNTAHAHCAAVDSGIAANSIYFLEEDDLDSYYVYNLEEGTIRMKPILYSMETTEDTELDWIMMPSHLSSPKVLKDDQEIICQDSEKQNKSSVEVEDEVQESWNMVPPELLNLIQLRLFGRDHAVFRGVCKAWQQSSIQCQKSSFQDYSIPSLLSSTTLLEQCQSSSPFLMYQEDITSSYDSVPIFRFFDPVHRKLYRTRIPELKEADIKYSRDGWLLVLRSSDQTIFFFNPFTREKIELPRMPPHLLPPHVAAYIDFLSFSSPPTCSNCLVVAMDILGWNICTLKHGDDTWREHELIRAEGSREYLCNILVIDGLHYFLCENRDMVVLNLKNDAEGQFLDRQIWPSVFRRSEFLRGDDFLVEIDGAPAFVIVPPNGGEVSIFEWNDMEKDWKLMEGCGEFGGKEMFLSKRGSFMEKIDDVGGIGHTIFLPMIDDAKLGVFYSLATRKYHTFYSGYSSELPYNVDKFLDGIWVKPDRKIVSQNNLQWFRYDSDV